jgi:DNA-binding response OmpR family regulator
MDKKSYILVIDDDPKIMAMIESWLKLEGYDVGIADDGETGLAMMEERSPDLVILDIMMPGIDGFQVLNSIRQQSNVPVIMFSARGEIQVISDALAFGADDYVKKPFDTREFLVHIRDKLRRTHSRLSS